MAKYDFFIAGRWRNKDQVKRVLDAVRAAGKSAYCFIENAYEGEKVEFKMDNNIEATMQRWESLPQDDAFIRTVFDADMRAEREAERFLLVLPAGNAGHIEAGVAYGMGKPCYAVGATDKTESLYCIFDSVFADVPALTAWLEEQ